jgi:hypothetical protein
MSQQSKCPRSRSGTLVPHPCPLLSGRAEAPGCVSGTLVPRSARRVSSTLPGLFTRGLPPNGIGFLMFRLLGRTRSPLKRLDPIMQGVRSMSIGR